MANLHTKVPNLKEKVQTKLKSILVIMEANPSQFENNDVLLEMRKIVHDSNYMAPEIILNAEYRMIKLLSQNVDSEHAFYEKLSTIARKSYLN